MIDGTDLCLLVIIFAGFLRSHWEDSTRKLEVLSRERHLVLR